jgi:hypothetical protein
MRNAWKLFDGGMAFSDLDGNERLAHTAAVGIISWHSLQVSSEGKIYGRVGMSLDIQLAFITC